MMSYKDFAITTKLMLLVVLAGGMALLLSCIAFVANDVRTVRASMVKQMSALASVLGSNCTAALSFQDSNAATEVLNSLRQQPAVEFACIYDASGRAFAYYHGADAPLQPPRAPTELGYDFAAGGYLDVVQQIDHNGQTIGTIFIRTSMAELYDQILRYVSIAAVVMIVSLGSSILLASRLQRIISMPILKLAEAAQQVSLERNYAIRVSKSANDELGILYDQFNAMLGQIQQGEAAIQRSHDELELKIEERTAELSRANRDLSREVTERVRAEAELETTHQKLMEAARRAGMAEIATGILHNVGNVLNTINVSANLVCDRMKQSRVNDLLRATQLMETHAGDLGTFITSDPKGKQLPRFLALLAGHFSDERAEVVKELDLLTTKVHHVKTIIATQQSYSGVSGIIETVDIGTTLDDAMKMNSASFDRHHIAIVRDYQPIPKVRLDKQKVLQILFNLMNNAKAALLECPHQKDRTLILRMRRDDDRYMSIHIIDNGVGIPPENMTRIFSHGFTTKRTGHGFGLHSCANAASELGGSLSAHSDGVGQGATFVLKLPYQPA
jgi:two-component system NtrC family sensor kinase